MHVLIGLIGLSGLLYYTATSGHTHAFSGLLYVPALVLLVFAPLFIAMISYSFEQLWTCATALKRSFGYSARKSRAALYEDLMRFATEIRQRRPAEALAAAEKSTHPLLRQLAPLVVKQYAAQSVESTSGTATYCLTSSLKRSEEILTTLSRVAPAIGLVGTVVGLIALLKDLSRFDQLGPSMALALLCTLYGLVLANAVYQPLARLIHSYATITVEESRLLTRALVLIGEGKPLADLRTLFELAAGSGAQVTSIDSARETGDRAVGT